MTCEVCEKTAHDKHHIKSRGSGGGNESWNILNVCRACHQKIHWYGPSEFSRRNPKFKEVLERKGWEVPVIGKIWHSPS